MDAPRLLPAGVMALAALVFLAACREHSVPPAPESQRSPVLVTLTVVSNTTHVVTEEVVGTVRPKVRAVLEAKITGRVASMPVVTGQSVRRDELLAELAAPETQARVDQARAIAQQAQSDLLRFQSLLRDNVITQAEFDAVEARYRVAVGGLSEAETMLGYTRVTAPFDGVVARKFSDVGDLAAPGKPLLELEAVGALRVEAGVPEALIGNLALGDSLRLVSGTNVLRGAVAEIAPAADPGSRTVQVKLDLPANAPVRSGQFVRLAVPVVSTPQVRVPAGAVIRRGQLEYVFVAADGHARLRLVRTGKQFPGEVEIVSGLDSGEHVVLPVPPELRDGDPIHSSP